MRRTTLAKLDTHQPLRSGFVVFRCLTPIERFRETRYVHCALSWTQEAQDQGLNHAPVTLVNRLTLIN